MTRFLSKRSRATYLRQCVQRAALCVPQLIRQYQDGPINVGERQGYVTRTKRGRKLQRINHLEYLDIGGMIVIRLELTGWMVWCARTWI
jgi:hypothetical protein